MIITVTLNPAIDKIYWVDRLRIEEEAQEEFLTRAVRSQTSAGGKGINISIFLARLGVENVAMGFVGGHTGHVVVRDLRDEGVTTNFVWVEGETRTNVTILERGREFIPIMVSEEGQAVSPVEMERFMRRYKRIVRRADWVILAGSLPPGVEPDTYRVLAAQAQAAGAKVAVMAGGTPLARVLAARPDIVKPDTREHLVLENTHLSTRERIIAVGRKVVEHGVGMVVISHEVVGDLVITKDGGWDIESRVPATRFKNLVGADDALIGGIVYKLHSGAPLEEALRFGMAAGIASAESEEKLCNDVDEISHEMERITLTPLGGKDAGE